MQHNMPLQEEIKRRLEQLTESSRNFDKASTAMQKAAQLDDPELRQEAAMAQWRKGQTAQKQYLAANDWLNEHHVSFIFNQQEKRYILIQEKPIEPENA